MMTKTKKIIRKIHLWLGLSSGIIIVFLGITGCMLAFEREIETLQTYRYVTPQEKSFIAPSVLKETATQLLPGKTLHSVLYGTKEEAAQMIFYNEDPEYYYIIFMNPYTGNVLKVKNMDKDFFQDHHQRALLFMAAPKHWSANSYHGHIDICDHDDKRAYTLVATK